MFCVCVYLQYLPVYAPNEEEKKDAQLYAANVQKLVAKLVHLRIDVCMRVLAFVCGYVCLLLWMKHAGMVSPSHACACCYINADSSLM